MTETANTEQEQLASAVVSLLMHVVKQTKRRLQGELARQELTLAQAHALHSLSHAGGRLSLRELGQECDMLASTATGVVDRLEQAELVRRERDRADRRVVWVDLTPAGRARAGSLTLFSDELARAFAVLGADELRGIKQSVEQVLAGMETGGSS